MADIEMLIGKTLPECEEIIKSNKILSNGWCFKFKYTLQVPKDVYRN